MSVHNQVSYTATEKRETSLGRGIWRNLTFASALCLLIALAWSSDVVNAAQIVAATLLLSAGLSVRAIMKLDEVDENGIEANASLIETLAVYSVMAGLVTISLIAAANLFAPFGGAVSSLLFALTFTGLLAATLTLETVFSVAICFAIKPLLSKSAIGAEIAVMLNLQQKYQTQLA